MAHNVSRHDIHRNWYVNQGFLSEQRQSVDEEMQRKLEQLILHGYSKVSSINSVESQRLGLQTNPCFLEENVGYHRVTRNDLLDQVDEAYARSIGLKQHELRVISSPLFIEVIEREIPQSGLNVNIASVEEFEDLLDTILNGDKLENRVLINISQLLGTDSIKNQKIVHLLEDTVIKKLRSYFGEQLKARGVEIVREFLGNLHLIAFVDCKEEHLLLMPEFFLDMHERFDSDINEIINCSCVRNRHGKLDRILHSMISRNGYRLSPAEAKFAWLKVSSLEDILTNLNLRIQEPRSEGKIPRVCENFKEFLRQPVVAQFYRPSLGEDPPPYLRFLPKVTLLLLEGLGQYNKDGRDIDGLFAAKGLSKLLQISYFRMLNAMREAIHVQRDLVRFSNEIEIIHQEIQNILALLEPYDASVFSASMLDRLRRGDNPVISREIDGVKAYLKASAMHGFSSILAGIEKQKGSQNLNVLVLNNSYYFASNANLRLAKSYDLFVLREEEREEVACFDRTVDSPIDVYVTEFHHNILLEKKIYRPVNVMNHIKELYQKGLMAEKCTVVIDTTIDLEKSDDIIKLLSDPFIVRLIREGKLNITLLRSAQKFDMVGIDNYYGGIIVSINNQDSFQLFNRRMDLEMDQLKGLDYQGLTHFQRYGEGVVDDYRKELMSNTLRMYEKISKKSIYYEGNNNPMQISRIEDDKMFFLDIKFHDYPKSRRAFILAMQQFVRDNKLFFTTRASFGFINTNLTIIDGECLRFSPGLESEFVLKQYGLFFEAIQNEIDQTGSTQEDRDTILADRIERMNQSLNTRLFF